MNWLRATFRILSLAISLGLAALPSPLQANDPKPAASDHGAKKGALPPSLLERSDHYVHRWLPFPAVDGRRLLTGQKFHYEATPGRAVVLVFVASWCLPCQQLIKPLKEMQAKFSSRYTDFIYIFAHDTEPDAKGFAAQYKLDDEAVIGSAALLETFHQPELPSVYVGDRTKWMIMRKLNTTPKDLEEISRYLDVHTAF